MMLCGYAVMWSSIFFMWFHHYVMWFRLHVFLASLVCQALVPRFTRYHELVRPVFRWIPVPSLSGGWRQQNGSNRKFHLLPNTGIDPTCHWTSEQTTLSPLLARPASFGTNAARTSVIDSLLPVAIDRWKGTAVMGFESTSKQQYRAKNQISGFLYSCK